jgi:hypothetical protein
MLTHPPCQIHVYTGSVYLTGRGVYMLPPICEISPHVKHTQGVSHREGCGRITPATNEGCTRSLRISHTSRRAPLQPALLIAHLKGPVWGNAPQVLGPRVLILYGALTCQQKPLPVKYLLHVQCVSYREGCGYREILAARYGTSYASSGCIVHQILAARYSLWW